MNELKSCPFCGGKAEIFRWQAHINDEYHSDLVCTNCGAKMGKNEVENLKRCSCGDKHYCPEVEKDENGKWFIRCHMCHKIVWGNTIEEAVNAWNGSQNCGTKMDWRR